MLKGESFSGREVGQQKSHSQSGVGLILYEALWHGDSLYFHRIMIFCSTGLLRGASSCKKQQLYKHGFFPGRRSPEHHFLENRIESFKGLSQ